MNRRIIGLLSLGHLITDINQGAVPVLLPFLIAAHDLSYTAAAGIVFAVNVSSTIVQPLFGHAADRFSKPWLMPLGLILAGSGLSLTGIAPGYFLIILAAIVCGIGIAAYHPEGARLVNFVAGEKKATAMSIFGVGGTAGFAVGPLLMTAVLLNMGLRGSLILIIPVMVMAAVLVFHLPQLSSFDRLNEKTTSAASSGVLVDQWRPFARLTTVIIGRSILFYGLNTFIPLYWIHVLHQSKAAAGTALTIWAGSAVIGNLIGGKLADRFGNRKIMLSAICALIPLLPALIWTTTVFWATLLLVPIGAALAASYSPAIITGQRYLPNHIGFSSGITLGVAVAIGGIAAPLLGKIADIHGIWWALAAIAFLPALTAGMVITLPQPKR